MSGTSEKLEVSVKKETKKEKASKAGRGEGSGKTVAAKTEAEPRRNRRGSSEQEEVEESASNNKDGSDDEAQFTEMEEEQPSRKRLKGTNGRARPSETGDLRNERSIMVPTVKVFQRDAKDGYLPGSIVRICCEHFLTYDFVEFSPGPHMNMILGPNGTGKSTIACAICIGLGFSVSVLGRAEVLTAFVKHGYDKGFVEIELKGPLGKPNVVIRRNITTMSNASTWTLNGKNSNKRTIEDKVADLGIQVSNLCSFLPQDRVQEFAKLKPEELLAETQKVAGHPRLKQWHDQLKELGTSLADIRGALVANQQDCATEEGKNQLLERDVVIFNKRKKLEEDLSYYEILVPWYKFKLNKGRVKQCKLAYRQAGIKLANARAEFEPATRFKERLEGKLQTLNRDGSAAQDAIKDLQKKVERLKRDDKRMSEQYTEIQDAIVTLSRDDQESKVKIQRLESDIRRFKDQLREHKGHSETDTTELIAQKEALNRQIRQIERQRNDIAESMRELDGKIREVESEQRKARDELRKLEDKTEQRQMNMANTNEQRFRGIASKEFMRAYNWLMEHRAEFKNVIQPACFSVTVPDQRYCHFIEAVITPAHMRTFIFDNEGDYKRFNEYLDRIPRGEYRPTSWFRPRPEDWPNDRQGLTPPEQSVDDLRRHGFDGFAIDFVDAPKEVTWFLCRSLDMHRVGVALDQARVDPEAASRLFSPRNPGAPSRYCIGFSHFLSNRSQYGQRLVQTAASNLSKAIWFTEQTADPSFKMRCQDTITLADQAITEKRAEKEELDRHDAELNEKEKNFKRQQVPISNRIEEIKAAITRVRNLERSIRDSETRLQAEQARPPKERRERALKQNLVTKTKERLNAIPQFKRVTEELNSKTHEFTRITFESLQVMANIAAMEQVVHRYGAATRDLEREVNEFAQRVQALEAEKEELAKTVTQLMDNLSPAVIERQQAYIEEHPVESVDLDALEEQRVATQAELASTGQVNRAVIQQYEDRQKKIAALRETIARREHEKEKEERKVQTIKDQWLPELNALIEQVNIRFSAAFDRIRCAGEVRLAQDDDFNKWAIEILVKFRSNEPLQLLTGQRQSGGERSLTTILYLMSLTGLAKTPFALVDEINQGMDVKYERAVHNELIQVTCAEDSGQYFLITPKLLPNLTYHERVTTLVINNGDYLPETRDEKGKVNNYGDLSANLVAYRRTARKA